MRFKAECAQEGDYQEADMQLRSSALSASITAVLLLLGATPAAAQHMNAKDAPCREPASNVDATNCFYREARAREAELAEQFGRVRPAIGGDELALFNRAQTNWIAYRKFQCDGEHAMYEGGTAASMVRQACIEALTRDRIKQLHDAYDWRIEKHQWTVEHPNGR